MNKTKQIAWSIIVIIFFALIIIFTRPASAESPIIIYPECQNAPTAIQKYACEQVALNWGVDHWMAFKAIIDKESKWNPEAKNPRSSAYGLGQFLDSTWKTTNTEKTANPYIQIDATITYISKNYKTPKGAISFHKVHNWY